jgi:hypothetical protein
MLEDARRGMAAGQHDVGERLVVTQQHVEAWAQALDQVRFEQQRLDLGARDDELHGRRLAHHPADAVGVKAPIGIVGDALLEAARLADIEHVAGRVHHAIDAGGVGQPLDQRLDHLGPDHAVRVAGMRGPVDLGKRKIGADGHNGFADVVGAILDVGFVASDEAGDVVRRLGLFAALGFASTRHSAMPIIRPCLSHQASAMQGAGRRRVRSSARSPNGLPTGSLWPRQTRQARVPASAAARRSGLRNHQATVSHWQMSGLDRWRSPLSGGLAPAPWSASPSRAPTSRAYRRNSAASAASTRWSTMLTTSPSCSRGNNSAKRLVSATGAWTWMAKWRAATAGSYVSTESLSKMEALLTRRLMGPSAVRRPRPQARIGIGHVTGEVGIARLSARRAASADSLAARSSAASRDRDCSGSRPPKPCAARSSTMALADPPGPARHQQPFARHLSHPRSSHAVMPASARAARRLPLGHLCKKPLFRSGGNVAECPGSTATSAPSASRKQAMHATYRTRQRLATKPCFRRRTGNSS